MRKSLPWLSFGLMLAATLTSGGARAQEIGVFGPGGYNGPMNFQLSGQCSADMTPDKAVIVGGVSSGNLRPTDAADQLDMQIAAMRTYIEQNHGQLLLKERVRTMKNPGPQQPNREEAEPPYQVIQRLQAEFPINANMDAILQKLIELGLDRFGDNVLNNYNRRDVVVRYHISDFQTKLADLQQRCTADAWTTWCTANAKYCPSKDAPANLELQSFMARSDGPLLRPDGNNIVWQYTVNRAQKNGDPPELVGNVPLHITATVNLSYHQDAAPTVKP